ncbi:MAG: M28 family peptidase [Bacteroidota bacterium]
MKTILRTGLLALVLLWTASGFLSSCGNGQPEPDDTVTVKPETAAVKKFVPDFNADSAYAFTQAQVDMGPRVPGTPAHQKCLEYIVAKMRSYGLQVVVQTGSVAAYNGKTMPVKNIIASYKKENPDRVLLCGHWDTRPFADKDSVNSDKPNDAASDGASQVAVMIEIARLLSLSRADVGIDFIFFDMEDYGEEYCQGSQYWAQNLHVPNYYARYGILMDMVGGRGAKFPIEGHSWQYAPAVVQKIWKKASELGYGNYFDYAKTNPITDDHYYVNTMANIPCVDIIQIDPVTGSFGEYHHRHSDNMDIIDRNTLKAVGQTVTAVVYSE